MLTGCPRKVLDASESRIIEVSWFRVIVSYIGVLLFCYMFVMLWADFLDYEYAFISCSVAYLLYIASFREVIRKGRSIEIRNALFGFPISQFEIDEGVVDAGFTISKNILYIMVVRGDVETRIVNKFERLFYRLNKNVSREFK